MQVNGSVRIIVDDVAVEQFTILNSDKVVNISPIPSIVGAARATESFIKLWNLLQANAHTMEYDYILKDYKCFHVNFKIRKKTQEEMVA